MRLRRIVAWVALVLLAASIGGAQTMPTGTLTSKVLDPDKLGLRTGLTSTEEAANTAYRLQLAGMDNYCCRARQVSARQGRWMGRTMVRCEPIDDMPAILCGRYDGFNT